MATTMTKTEKELAVKEAWGVYRANAAALSSDRRLGWSDYLEADGRLWRNYLATEKQIAAYPEPATKAA